MFDLVHKYKKTIQVLMVLIAITFATWGIESYTGMIGGRDTVATVNGMDISTREFGDELQRQHDQMRQLFGRNFDPATMDTPESRSALLDSLINQRLVASEAVSERLTITDQSLRDTIAAIPAFKGADGNFSSQTYREVLRQQNPPLTPAQFEGRLRYDLSLAQLARAVGEAAIPPRAVTERLAALEAQQREISESRITAQQFLPQVKVDEAQLKSYYEANQDAFRIPERVKAEYVMLSSEALAAAEKVTPEEVRKHWESSAGPKVREKEEALKKAQAIAAEVKKNPASFAEVAKRESQDPGSKDNGGDLGFAPRGSFVKPYEDALYRLKEGQISDVVESEFGFHIIRLTAIQRKEGKEERRSSHILIPAPADAKPFEAMRDQIEADLKKQRAQRRYAEVSEAFNNIVYEQPESLKPAADKFDLKVQTTGWISRSQNQELGALDNPKLLAALFSSDSLQNKRNTDAIEVAPGTLVAARVIEHQPAAQRKFEEVRGEIADLLRRREAAELARKDGAAKLEKLRQGADAGVKWSNPKTVSRRETQGVPMEMLRPVLSADVAKLPAYVGLPVADAGYVLVRISKVTPGAISEQQAAQAKERVAGMVAGAQYDAFVASLRERADVDVNRKALEKK
jgi:peptidyl-prolyl cis-trans isomerase D